MLVVGSDSSFNVPSFINDQAMNKRPRIRVMNLFGWEGIRLNILDAKIVIQGEDESVKEEFTSG